MLRAAVVFALCLSFAGLPVAVDACTTVCEMTQRSARPADPVCHKPAPGNAVFGRAPHACQHESSVLAAPAEGLPSRALLVASAVMMPALPFAQSAQIVSIDAVPATSPPAQATPPAFSPLRI